MYVAVSVTGGGGDPGYKWTISGGKIIEGQGTPAIKIDTTGMAGTTITVEVEILGLCPECLNKVSANVKVVLE